MKEENEEKHLFEDGRKRPRYSGILLHSTSLPGRYGIGDLGRDAWKFIDFLDEADQSVWQCLPLGPLGSSGSPYQSLSAFAGNILLISPDLLAEDGLLEESDLADCPDFSPYTVDYEAAAAYKTALLELAYRHFLEKPLPEIQQEYETFIRRESFWLDDYALFCSVSEEEGTPDWTSWTPGLAKRRPEALEAAKVRLAQRMGYYRFTQYLFSRQWDRLHRLASSRHITLIGDIPIYLSENSADVWANPELFELDSTGHPTDVSGVPPDYFSATGQLWNNPLYNWPEHKRTGYAWWIARIRRQVSLTDIVRLDHFRGLEAYWSVPAGEKTAVGGHWCKGPGSDFLKALRSGLGGRLPLIAEDLGIITPPVRALRDEFGLPGMKVLQFAFDGDESDYLPYLYDENCICYTGTHDNNTTLGWFMETDEAVRERVRSYLHSDGSDISWEMIRLAVSSVARYAIYPLQDVLGYGGDCRMNIPGVAEGNWNWRFTWEALSPDAAARLRELNRIYGRSRSRLEG